MKPGTLVDAIVTTQNAYYEIGEVPAEYTGQTWIFRQWRLDRYDHIRDCYIELVSIHGARRYYEENIYGIIETCFYIIIEDRNDKITYLEQLYKVATSIGEVQQLPFCAQSAFQTFFNGIIYAANPEGYVDEIGEEIHILPDRSTPLVDYLGFINSNNTEALCRACVKLCKILIGEEQGSYLDALTELRIAITGGDGSNNDPIDDMLNNPKKYYPDIDNTNA